jgi:hypothetical protein
VVKFRKEVPSLLARLEGTDDPVLKEKMFKKLSKGRGRVYLHTTSNTFTTRELFSLIA